MHKNTLFISIVLIFGLSIFFISCENENVLKPMFPKTIIVDTCKDTLYSCRLKFIFDSNCLPCHNSATKTSGVIVDTYEGAASIAKDGTRLSDAINHKNSFIKMPNGKPKLPDSTIKVIEKWIFLGAPK